MKFRLHKREILPATLAVLFFIGNFLFYFQPRFVFGAVTYPTAYLRLDRMKASTTTGGMICAKTSATHTTSISDVQVTFPTGFTVNGTASNWTVTTTNLPSGATAWPNITTASGVSSQTVTFAESSNATLTANTLYCFNFAASSTLTNSTAGANKTGTIVITDTTPSSSETINYATAVIANDQITVTASVPALFSFSLSGTTAVIGAVNTSTVTSSSAVTGTISTNAKNGWISWVNGSANGLYSTIAATAIPAPGTYANVYDLSATTGYALDVDAGTGSPTPDDGYNGTDTNSGGVLSTTPKIAATKATPGSGDTFDMIFRVKVTNTQPAATDYTDTVTVTAAGQF